MRNPDDKGKGLIGVSVGAIVLGVAVFGGIVVFGGIGPDADYYDDN
ncbi:MAG: hypothetical protein V3U79_04805 [Dehalococcoidia bacterium]